MKSEQMTGFFLNVGLTRECHTAATSPPCPFLLQAIPGILSLPPYLINNGSREIRSTRPTSER